MHVCKKSTIYLFVFIPPKTNVCYLTMVAAHIPGSAYHHTLFLVSIVVNACQGMLRIYIILEEIALSIHASNGTMVVVHAPESVFLHLLLELGVIVVCLDMWKTLCIPEENA